MKTITTTQLRMDIGSLRLDLEDGPVRVIWREPKPNGKVVFTAIIEKEQIK